jgi:hypothetical protein
MQVAGSLSMSGGRILQLLQSGYQECLRIGGFHRGLLILQTPSLILRKNFFPSSLKLQLGGLIFCVSALFFRRDLFNFTGLSGLLIRVVLHQNGIAQAKGSWELGPVGLWLLMP